MAPRKVIVWLLCLGILVLLMTTYVQAQEPTEVSASKILEQIENGEDIYYENVRITGELDLSELELETVFVTRPVWQISTFGLEKELNIVESKIAIKNSTFGNEVDFSDTQLIKSLDFQDSSFLDRANFTNARFTGPANFYNVSFDGDAVFSDVSFTDLVSFGYADFSGVADFEGADFSGFADFLTADFSCVPSFFFDADFSGVADFWDADFSGFTYFQSASFSSVADFHDADFSGFTYFFQTDFSGDADFRDANFSGDTKFIQTDFSGDAWFNNANFSGDTFFYVTSFSGDAWFNNANFSGDTKFINANFRSDTHFYSANFTGNADFYGTSFYDDANFYGANFSGYTSFSNAKFDRVDFLNTSFTEVSLYEADFDSMKVNWTSFKKPLVETNPQSFDGPTYVKLIKNFRTLEQFDDADDAYFWYRFRSLTGIVDVFMLLSCGFGVIPYLPLIWGLFIVLLFAGFYKRGNGIRRLKENDEDDSRVSYGDALYFSIVTFTTVGFGDWYPVDRYRKAAVVIEGLLGWLTLALFLVTLANVMIRP